MKRQAFALTIGIILFFIAVSVQAQNAGEVGTMQCRGVQKAVQINVGDWNSNIYKTTGTYKSKVAHLVNQAAEADLINNGCSGCIVSKFAHLTPVFEQKACGPDDILPTQSCEATKPTDQQIRTAIDMLIPQFADPWGNAVQFETLLKQTEQILGCKLGTDPNNAQLLKQQTPLQQTTSYAKPGVNYCGPGTSENNKWLKPVTVPACLNEACFQHDICYGKNCITKDCYWSTQSQSCDNRLLSVCKGQGSCSSTELWTPMAKAICAIVEYEYGTSDKRDDDHPICKEPASLQTCGVECKGQNCATYTECNPSSGCIDPVCGSIVEGGGVCVEGMTPCDGLATCTKSDACDDGLCFESSCCGRSVCVGTQAFCPDIGVAQSATSATKSLQIFQGEPTVGSCFAH